MAGYREREREGEREGEIRQEQFLLKHLPVAVRKAVDSLLYPRKLRTSCSCAKHGCVSHY